MYQQSRGEGFGAEVKRRIMLGTYALSSGYKDAYYLKALKVRRLIQRRFRPGFRALRRGHGPDLADAGVQDRRAQPTIRWRCTCPTSTPSAPTWPASRASAFRAASPKPGLPIGLQILAPPFEEEKLLRIARMHEQATDWHTRRPILPGSV